MREAEIRNPRKQRLRKGVVSPPISRLAAHRFPVRGMRALGWSPDRGAHAGLGAARQLRSRWRLRLARVSPLTPLQGPPRVREPSIGAGSALPARSTMLPDRAFGAGLHIGNLPPIHRLAEHG